MADRRPLTHDRRKSTFVVPITFAIAPMTLYLRAAVLSGLVTKFDQMPGPTPVKIIMTEKNNLLFGGDIA